MDILEPTPEVQSVGCLPYALHHPKRYYKPSSKLPSAYQMKFFLKRVALLLQTDAPTVCGAYQSSASGSLGHPSDDSWRPGLAAKCPEQS